MLNGMEGQLLYKGHAECVNLSTMAKLNENISTRAKLNRIEG
jgi:hypothetical protein